jgi:KDO2-lipid IV(A) lauroyltransferase
MKPQTLANALFTLTAWFMRLPWRWLRGLADAVAWSWVRLDARESNVARRNLELTYPELLASQRDELHRRILRTTARQAFETLRLWTRPPVENLAHIRELHNHTLYDAALASGKGVIVVAPHFGNWELLNQWLASRGPIAIVYNPPDSPVGDAFLLRVRGADNIRQVRAEGPAVRQLWKVLKEGGAVGILPDQQPKMGDGEFAPFFGVQALTMTLVSRLAERTGATVLFAWCERINADLEFALHVQPAPKEIADSDPLIAVAALNAMIERIARRDPAQYQWTYKRFGARPPGSGEPNPYKEKAPE